MSIINCEISINEDAQTKVEILKRRHNLSSTGEVLDFALELFYSSSNQLVSGKEIGYREKDGEFVPFVVDIPVRELTLRSV